MVFARNGVLIVLFASRKLDIKWLEDGYGGILDGNCTVDECFEDRAGGKVDTKDFTVRVIRAPPDPAELPDTPNQTRSGSLAPNSSARPRKRSAITLSGIETGDHDYTQLNGSGEPPNKRQRLENQPTQDIPDPDQPILSKERDLDEPNAALANSIGHTSFSIPDSQYDDSATPTRGRLHDPQLGPPLTVAKNKLRTELRNRFLSPALKILFRLPTMRMLHHRSHRSALLVRLSTTLYTTLKCQIMMNQSPNPLKLQI